MSPGVQGGPGGMTNEIAQNEPRAIISKMVGGNDPAELSNKIASVLKG